MESYEIEAEYMGEEIFHVGLHSLWTATASTTVPTTRSSTRPYGILLRRQIF